MTFRSLSFRGPLSLAARFAQCAGSIAVFDDVAHECVSADWNQEPHSTEVVGHVLFTPVAEPGDHPVFPPDLLEQLLASAT